MTGVNTEFSHKSIDELTGYERNSRTHSEEQIEQIAASILEFGWTVPVLVRGETGVMAAGHGRVAAARLLEERGQYDTSSIPVITAWGWTDDQFKAYVIADNKIAENAGWDQDILRLELGELKDSGFDLRLTGFEKEELTVLFAVGTEGLTDPDVAPPKPAKPKSKLGDVWILGNHRIVCGDSTDAVTISRLLGDETPKLMVTDPPYGVDYDPEWRVKAGVGGKGTATGKVLNDDRADWQAAWALFPGEVCYVWHGGLHSATVQASLEAQNFRIRAQIIWQKTRFALGRGDYHWQHEPAWYAVREGQDDGWVDEQRYAEEHGLAAYAVRAGGKSLWNGDRKQSTLWQIEHVKSDTGHGTQKPVECMKRPIENNSLPGHAIYEPFSGSGTTIIAAEMTGRRCFACELDPGYVDVAVTRWEEFTGRKAVHARTGKEFKR